MDNLILVLNVILAILLDIVILLQKSEGGALGIGVSQESYISSRSAGNFLTKATAIIATLFIITSISLTIISKEALHQKVRSSYNYYYNPKSQNREMEKNIQIIFLTIIKSIQ